MWLSLQVAGLATAVALVLGLWLVYRMATREFTGRTAVLGLLALAFATPTVILAWAFLRPAFPWQAGAAVGVIAALPPLCLGTRGPLQRFESGIRQRGAELGLLGVADLLARAAAAWLAARSGRRPAIAFVRVLAEWSIVAAL